MVMRQKFCTWHHKSHSMKLATLIHDNLCEKKVESFRESMIIIKAIIAFITVSLFVISVVYTWFASLLDLNQYEDTWNKFYDLAGRSLAVLYFIEYIMGGYAFSVLCDQQMPNTTCKKRVMARMQKETPNRDCQVCYDRDTVFHCCRCTLTICEICYGRLLRKDRRQTCPQCRILVKRHYVKIVKD